MLDSAAATYVNSRHGVVLSDGRLTVSSLYTWYKSDFGGDDRAVIDHLSTYAEPDLRADLSVVSEISGEHYDWRLNDQNVVQEPAAPAPAVMAPADLAEELPGDKLR